MPDKAIPELKKAIDLSRGNPTCTANLARAYAAIGERNKALGLVDDLKRRSRPGFGFAAELAVIYAALGNNDEAMHWVETGAEEKSIRECSFVRDSVLFEPILALRPFFDAWGCRSSPGMFWAE